MTIEVIRLLQAFPNVIFSYVCAAFDKISTHCVSHFSLRELSIWSLLHVLICNIGYKYLGHMIEHTLRADSDITRELKYLFVRANILNRRF